METTHKKQVRVAFLDEETQGIGPNGRGTRVAPGAYIIADLDGMEPGMLMLQVAGSTLLLAIVQESDANHIQEVLDGPHARDWAAYYRAHPNTVASWGEQNGRRPGAPYNQED